MLSRFSHKHQRGQGASTAETVEAIILSDERLIIGLGNPGAEYSRTRHNLGFLVVDELVRRSRLSWQMKEWCQAQVVDGRDGDVDFILLKPLTFMNRSGTAVSKFLSRQAIDLSHLLVVCDDLNLEFGQIRLRTEGSAGGHNGLSSIMETLATKEFPRLRLGIGKPGDPARTVDYVLDRFLPEEDRELGLFVGRAADCCGAWLREDLSQVMSQFNKRNEHG